jgi:hypothetical protein
MTDTDKPMDECFRDNRHQYIKQMEECVNFKTNMFRSFQ